MSSPTPDPDSPDRLTPPDLLDSLDMLEESDEPFVPPEPPPLPIFAPATVLYALAAIAGLFLLIFPELLSSFLEVSTQFALILAAGLLFVGAIGLISRLRNPDPEDPEDEEHGAQV